MLEIYFDGVLLDPNNYIDLSQKWVMFDKEFKLGMTPSREFSLTIPKSVFNPDAKEVKIKYMNEDYAYLIIDKYSYDESAVPKVKITLVDKMIKADFNYDASPICPTTLKGILLDICSKIGVELGNEKFDNEDEVVNFFDNTVIARDYISYISEMAGGYARIEKDGKLWIRKFSNEDTTVIDANLCEQIIIGQPHEVERVVYDNGIIVFKKARPSKNLYHNSDTFDENGNSGWVIGGIVDTTEIKDKSYSVKTNSAWQGPAVNLKKLYEESKIQVGDVLTYSVYFKTNFIPTGNKPFSFTLYRGSKANPGITFKNFPYNEIVPNKWYRLSCTFEVTEYSITSERARIETNYYNGDDPYYFGNDRTNYIWFSQPMVEKGSTLSEYEPDGDLSEDNSLETVYINPSNVYCNTQEEFDLVADNIIGFKYYNIDTGKTYILNNTMCGDVLKLNYQGQDYFTIQNTPSLKFLGVWQGSYVLNVESKAQAETKVNGLNTQVKAIKIKQNRDENVLSIAVEDIKTQKEVTNTEIFNQINANTTLIQQTATEITQNVTEIAGNLQGNIDVVANDLTDTTNQLLTLSSTVTQNNQSVQTQINQINTNLENGVERVKNTLVTIDINGIQVSTNVSKINSVMQNNKFAIQDNSGTDLIFVGYDEVEKRSKAEMDNLTVKNYFVAGYHRQEKFEINGEQRTGWFYVGGNI